MWITVNFLFRFNMEKNYLVFYYLNFYFFVFFFFFFLLFDYFFKLSEFNGFLKIKFFLCFIYDD